MQHASTFVSDLAVVLMVAGAAAVLFRWLRQPVVLGYLLAGLLLGPTIPLPLFADTERVEVLASFGVVLVMFSVGLGFSFRRLARVLPAAGVPALIQMGALAWLGILLGKALGWSDVECIFLGACLAVSSTMVVVRVIKEGAVPPPAAELAMGILVMQDLVAIVAIAGLTAVVSGAGLEPVALAATAGELALFLAALVVIGLLVVPRLVKRLVSISNPEMLVVAITGICFGLALLAERMGYSVALGAFVAGSLVAEAGQRETIGRLVQPIRDLFAAVFFVAVGMTVDPRQVLEVLPLGLAVIAIIIVGQLLSVALGGTLAGRGLATSVRAGAALGQIGEFSFIIASLGSASGVVRGSLFSAVVVAALVTTFTTSIAVRLSDRITVGLDAALPRRLRTTLSLYASWLEERPAAIQRHLHRSRAWRSVAAIGLDMAVLIALTLTTVLAHRQLAESLSEAFGLAERWSRFSVIAAAMVLAVPFLVGLLRSGHRLGRALAEAAFPMPDGQFDRAVAPRRAMARLLETAVVLLVAVLFAVATQPVLPVGWGVVVLLVATVGAGAVIWRSSGNLDQHVRAGAQAFAESLLQPDRPSADPHLSQVGELLPGLGDLTTLEVREGTFAAGRSLAELNLRGHTGATVLAVRRGGQVYSLPGGEWLAEPGDLLGLTGSSKAVEAAQRLLESEPAP